MTRQARDLICTLNGQADLFDVATDHGSEEMSFAFRDRPFVDQLVSKPQLYGEDLFSDLYRVDSARGHGNEICIYVLTVSNLPACYLLRDKHITVKNAPPLVQVPGEINRSLKPDTS